MIHHEAFLNAPHGKTFQARLYYNREATAFRQTTMHAHPPMEISIPGRDGVYIVGEKEIPFEAGDVFLFRSSEKHGISQLHGDGDALCLGFHFFPDTFWTSFEQELVPEFIAAFSPTAEDFKTGSPAEVRKRRPFCGSCGTLKRNSMPSSPITRWPFGPTSRC